MDPDPVRVILVEGLKGLNDVAVGDRTPSPGSSDGHEEEVAHFYLRRGELGDHRVIEEPDPLFIHLDKVDVGVAVARLRLLLLFMLLFVQLNLPGLRASLGGGGLLKLVFPGWTSG